MATIRESLIGGTLRSLLSYHYHRQHMMDAKGVLKRIERAKGPLSRRLVKQCNDYAIDVFGHRHFAAWLYVYSAVAGKFMEGWIPDNYYGSVVRPRLKGVYGKISGLKSLHPAIFSSESFPDILSYVNGVFFDTDYRVINPDSVKGEIFSGRERVVFKLDNSSRGKGIWFLDRESFDLSKVCGLGNGVFQSLINQHELFREFAGASVATLRMTTVITDTGTTSLRACYLRLGNGTDTHVQSSSHIRIPIDIKTGAFNHVGFTTDWLEIESHPASKVKFEGKLIPVYDDCRKLVTSLHQRVPYARCIGWDLAVDDQERVRIMEWNAQHNDIKFSEATQGPCFSDLQWERLIRSSEETPWIEVVW
ncbi:sugar-transfer associated ATP-grasp domain-containing protein [Nitrospira sp. BLG_1]|uniref:sugar-transfer associated ATP-grasp domain-containing protein n=1 Tax=Nitrospira sp. BLG_1 TaxID=3395883 RepID=UPI0039BD0A66